MCVLPIFFAKSKGRTYKNGAASIRLDAWYNLFDDDVIAADNDDDDDDDGVTKESASFLFSFRPDNEPTTGRRKIEEMV